MDVRRGRNLRVASGSADVSPGVRALDALDRLGAMSWESAAIYVTLWGTACVVLTLILKSKRPRLPLHPVLWPILLFVLAPPVLIVMPLFLVFVYPFLAIRYSLGLNRAVRSAQHATCDEGGVTIRRGDSSQARTLAWVDIRECREVFTGPFWVYQLSLASGESVRVDFADGTVKEELRRRGIRFVPKHRLSEDAARGPTR